MQWVDHIISGAIAVAGGVAAGVAGAARFLAAHVMSVNTLQQRVDQIQTLHDQRLDQVEARVAEHGRRVDEDVGKIHHRLDELAAATSKIAQDVAYVRGRFDIRQHHRRDTHGGA